MKTVTNSNDFRRFSYQSEATALINSFDFARGSSAAPRLRPEPKKEQDGNLKVREGKGLKSKAQLVKEQKLSRAKAIRVISVAVICLAMIAVVIGSFAVKNQLTRQIAVKETEIANAQSEYISLQSELNSLVSMSMIDKYAVEKLGMSKIKSSQIQYMDVEAYKQSRNAALNKQSVDSGAKRLEQKQGINK